MISYLSESKYDFKGKIVLVRIDTDVDLKKENGDFAVDEDYRLKISLPTIHFLQKRGAKKIILLGHIGRPNGKVVSNLSLFPVASWFEKNLTSGCQLVDLEKIETKKEGVYLLENIRFYPGEEKNDSKFRQKLASLADVYVNEAFAVSHRNHASIVGTSKLLPSFLGLRFEGEVKALSWLLKKAVRPLVFVLGGSKKGKLDYIEFLSSWADKLLIGGMLPTRIKNEGISLAGSNVLVGSLTENGKEISEKTIEKFVKEIKSAATIVWAGPMGVYEEKTSRRGTEKIAKAISQTSAFRVAGGGDTHRVLSWFDLWKSFDFVSSGGGAMLEFLKDRSLVGMKNSLSG